MWRAGGDETLSRSPLEASRGLSRFAAEIFCRVSSGVIVRGRLFLAIRALARRTFWPLSSLRLRPYTAKMKSPHGIRASTGGPATDRGSNRAIDGCAGQLLHLPVAVSRARTPSQRLWPALLRR